MAAPETHDALDNLVNQFADPMSFFRELIQNSLDAGTPEIEVDFEYEPGQPGQTGVMIVHVNDFGEGMDRDIIDTKLTRLFSSSKDGDLTKIGRFGIGFVSVFAIQPDAVCLDTSRGGETWRVLFKRDRTFVRIARDEPVDGTKIRILKTMTPEEYEAFIARAREVVTYWCKHTRTEILFQGETVNQPFELDVPCKVHYEEEGTRVVVGYHPEEAGWFGFYNKGLTLHEGSGEFWPHVAFKVDSRYLEHTLTRDNVLRDDNFAKAREIVARLVGSELPAALLADLEARRDQRPDRDQAFLFRALARVARNGADPLWRHGERAIFRSVGGAPVTLEALRRAHKKKRLFVETAPSALVTRVEEEEGVVIDADRRAPAHEALAALIGAEPRRANALFCRPAAAAAEEEAAFAPLSRSLTRLLEAWGAKLTGVALAHFDTPGSAITDLVAITQRELGEATPLEDARQLGSSFFSRSRALVVNADHPTVRQLLALSAREPELAAYQLCKLFFLGEKLTTALDGELAAASVSLRRRRRAAGGR